MNSRKNDTVVVRKWIFHAIFLIISFLLFAYVIWRAAFLSFTYDECWSYSLITGNFKEMFKTTNNHLLNSFGMWLFSGLFGNHEFVLRIPSLIGFIFYLFYSYKLSKSACNQTLSLGIFILFNFNPYMLDFFSLARGYGMALGFLMASLYYTIVPKAGYNKKFRNYSIIFAALSILSNLIFLHYLVALLILIIFEDLSSKKISASKFPDWVKDNLIILIICTTLTVILYPVIITIFRFKGFDAGGSVGFWEDTVKSLIDFSYYFQKYPDWISLFLKGFLILIFLTGGILSFLHVFFHKRFDILVISFVLLAISVLSPIIQHWLIGSLFPSERTALFYLPIFISLFLAVLNKISSTTIRFKITSYIPIVLCFPIIYHCGKCANLHYTRNWKFDADTKFIIEKLNDTHKEILGTLNVGIDWTVEPSTKYYKLKYGYDGILFHPINIPWINENERNSEKNKYYEALYMNSIPSDIRGVKNFKLIENFPCSELTLFENDSNKHVSYIEKIKYMRNNILNNPVWLEKVRKKATDRNISLDSMIYLDAKYMIESGK